MKTTNLEVDYRKIWEEYYKQAIPKDDKGRSYEIHHIDGNRANNSIENLLCVSIEEHWRVHISRGEMGAANLIAKRFNQAYKSGWKHSESTIEKMSKSHKGLNTWSKGVQRGPQEQLKCPYCEKVGGRSGMKRFHFDNCLLKPGNEHLTRLLAEADKVKYRKPKTKLTKPQKVKCPHCDVVGDPRPLKRWHFENCKNKKFLG
jgi:hypothetical protein